MLWALNLYFLVSNLRLQQDFSAKETGKNESLAPLYRGLTTALSIKSTANSNVLNREEIGKRKFLISFPISDAFRTATQIFCFQKATSE